MRVIANDRTIPFDVDGTLIIHTKDMPFDDMLKVVDPVDPGSFVYVQVNHAMVRLLKEEIHKRSNVVVWSKGGYEWARNVLEALGITDRCITDMAKPVAYCDDLPVTDWMTDRIFIPSGSVYKNKTVPKRRKHGV